MKLKTLLSCLGLLLLAVTAEAAVITIPGCDVEVFRVVAANKIEGETGFLDLTGNVLVTNPTTGLAFLGPNNAIHGSALAHTVRIGTNGEIDRCVADTIEGAGTCVATGGTFAALPAECKTFPFPPVVSDPCVLSAPSVLVPEGQTQTLDPGCYRKVRVEKFATLILSAGDYQFNNLRLVFNSSLQGAGAGPGGSTVVVKENIILGPLSKSSNLSLASAATAGASSLDGGGNLTNVLYLAYTLHIHTGSTVTDSALAAFNRVSLEPSIFPPDIPPPPVCVCPPNFEFAKQSCLPGSKCEAARACVPIL